MQYGLIGEKLVHSFYRLIHGRLSSDSYELCELSPDQLPAFLQRRDFRGINVTIPYKQAVMPYLDEIGESARGAGAVNTIVNRDGKLYGYNTDYDGFIALAKHAGADLSGARVVILGAGGAAKAVRAASVAMGAASVVNAVRHPSEPEHLLLSDPASFEDCDIIVNATPVGMFPRWQDSPITLPSRPLRAVLDCIYNPLRTSLVLDAAGWAGTLGNFASLIPPVASDGPLPFTRPRAATVPCASTTHPAVEGGLYMLVAQAVRARELFAGEALPDEIIEREYRHLLHSKRNIVLCGMPSCGKSTLGRALADACGRRFVDTDEIVALQAGMDIPRIFELEGEAGFRTRETIAIESIAPEQGLVIATGGGAPIKEQNIKLLRHNGLICLIERDLHLLSPGSGRPLSRSRAELESLWTSRRAAYLRAAEVCIDNNGPLEDTIAQLLAYVD